MPCQLTYERTNNNIQIVPRIRFTHKHSYYKRHKACSRSWKRLRLVNNINVRVDGDVQSKQSTASISIKLNEIHRDFYLKFSLEYVMARI